MNVYTFCDFNAGMPKILLTLYIETPFLINCVAKKCRIAWLPNFFIPVFLLILRHNQLLPSGPNISHENTILARDAAIIVSLIPHDRSHERQTTYLARSRCESCAFCAPDVLDIVFLFDEVCSGGQYTSFLILGHNCSNCVNPVLLCKLTQRQRSDSSEPTIIMTKALSSCLDFTKESCIESKSNPDGEGLCSG